VRFEDERQLQGHEQELGMATARRAEAVGRAAAKGETDPTGTGAGVADAAPFKVLSHNAPSATVNGRGPRGTLMHVNVRPWAGHNVLHVHLLT
jgi:hypothetical protein